MITAEDIKAYNEALNNAPVPYPRVFFLDGVCYEMESKDSTPKAKDGRMEWFDPAVDRFLSCVTEWMGEKW
ncbi:hypothetical protein LCGC14_2800340 [marine sediment metagenome]|uniref:Uncharacterized protein n=1 Tax=marine sediment metagenome TaxID=412755 RepID=A0A0F9AWE1_9ZZZZ